MQVKRVPGTVFDKSNTKTITGTRFTCIYEDVSGGLWSGTDEGELMRFRDGEFTEFTTELVWVPCAVHKIQGNQKGEILVLTDRGFYFWQGDKFTPFFPEKDPHQTAIFLGSSGATWILDNQGLHQNRDGKVTSYPIKINFAENLIYDRCLYEDRYGVFWVCTVENGLYCIKDEAITHYPFPTNLYKTPSVEAQPISKNHLMSACMDKEGNLWIATLRGLVRRSEERR